MPALRNFCPTVALSATFILHISFNANSVRVPCAAVPCQLELEMRPAGAAASGAGCGRREKKSGVPSKKGRWRRHGGSKNGQEPAFASFVEATDCRCLLHLRGRRKSVATLEGRSARRSKQASAGLPVAVAMALSDSLEISQATARPPLVTQPDCKVSQRDCPQLIRSKVPQPSSRCAG